MEVQYFTNSRKPRKQLRVSLISTSKNRLHLEDLDQLLLQAELSSDSPDIEIDEENRNVRLLFSKPEITLPLSRVNLKTSFTLAEKYLDLEREQFEIQQKQDKVLSQFSKKLQSLPLGTTVSTTIDINHLFAQITKIKAIPQTILQIDLFKAFQSCQLLVHEKGKQIAKSYLSDEHIPVKISEIAALDFNHIYNQIKKSKNRLFNQAQTLQGLSGVLGTFLAKDYDLPAHRAVLIVSRNDFLPPSQEEQHYFTSFSNQLHTVYTRVLFQQKCRNKIVDIKSALHHAPFPISISNAEGQPILENHLLSKAKSLSRYPLPLGHSIELEISKNNNQYTDAYHLQRITLLGELLNTLRHELGNPLFGIKLAADLLASSVITKDSQEILSEIARSCQRCQTILEDFSYLYRDENTLTPINLTKVLNETFVLAKSATQHIKRKIILPPELNTLELQSNPTWISQIVFNLIINSAQALVEANTSAPLISLEVKIKPHYLSLSVADNGPGITANIQKQIFEPFFTTKPKGTGLGLAICINLAKKLGAEFFFQNNSNGLGVTFTLRLPRGK